MQLSEISFDGARPVDGYGPGFFRIGGEVITDAILLTAQGVKSWGGLEDIALLLALEGEIDVLFLGTGSEMALPAPAFTEALEACNIGIEPMASPSACRSFNVALAEGRRIALAALSV